MSVGADVWLKKAWTASLMNVRQYLLSRRQVSITERITLMLWLPEETSVPKLSLRKMTDLGRACSATLFGHLVRRGNSGMMPEDKQAVTFMTQAATGIRSFRVAARDSSVSGMMVRRRR